MFKRYTYVEGLTNLNDNNEGVLINILGQVKNKYGNDLTITHDAQDHKVVNVQSWDGKRDYRVIDLIALQFKSLMIKNGKSLMILKKKYILGQKTKWMVKKLQGKSLLLTVADLWLKIFQKKKKT